jgi:hypothetical protein
MMMRRDCLHDRFVRSVHRRLVLVRAVERAGVCMTVAGGFCLIAALVLMSRRADALPLTWVAMLLGAGIGLAWGFIRRPKLIEAAEEADRQFNLSDLLSSALLSRGEDAWSRAVASMADQRCRSLNSNEVVLRRLGARAWGGIGLSIALVLSVGVMSNVMMQEPTSARGNEGLSAIADSSEAGGQPEHPIRPPAARERGALPERPGEQRGAPDPQEGSRSFERDQADAVEASASSQRRADVRHRESTGGGEAFSSSEMTNPQQMPDRGKGRGEDSSAGSHSISGEGASGATDEKLSGDIASAGGLGASSSGADSSSAKPLPWQSRQWSADQASAMHAVESGRVPDRSRDVVREYFKP